MLDKEKINENAGIYSLQHTKSKKIYIGQTTNLKSRITDHIYLLERNRHTNERLQEAYNEDPGIEIKILEEFDKPVLSEQIHRLEALYIQALDATNIEKGFNIKEPSDRLKTNGNPQEEIPKRRKIIKQRQEDLKLTPNKRNKIEKEIFYIENSLKRIKRMLEIDK